MPERIRPAGKDPTVSDPHRGRVDRPNDVFADSNAAALENARPPVSESDASAHADPDVGD